MLYHHIPADTGLSIPKDLGVYKCLLLIERPVSASFRCQVSQRLVETGCRYAMAWGFDCSLWDDSVDIANLERFDYGDIPDEDFVMTTWHERETLSEVFHFAKFTATLSYCDRPLTDLLVLDFAIQNRAGMMTRIYQNTV